MPSTRLSTALVVATVLLTVLAPLGTAAATTTTTESSTTESTTTANSAVTALPDDTVADGGSYWLGQTLESTDWSVDALELQAESDGSWAFVSEVRVEDGAAVFDTDGLDPGRYRLVAANGDRTVSFALRAHALDVTASTSTVWNEPDRSESTTNLTIQSNRDGYDLAVTAAELDAAALREVLGRGETVDRDDDGTADAVVLTDLGTTATVTADFARIAPGNLTLAFTAVDTTAAANATFEVAEPLIVEAAFNETVVRATDDGIVRIPVDVIGDGERATVVVGSDDESVEFVATVADADGDGRAVLVWNTTTTQTAAAALDAEQGTTLVDAERRRVDGNASEVAVTGEYPLSLYPGDGTDADETDVAVAVVSDEVPTVRLGRVDAPDEVHTGESFQVAATVENAGDSDETRTVELVREGETVTSKRVELAPGETTSVTFRAAVDVPGTYDYSVSTGESTTGFDVRVRDPTTTVATTATTTGPATTTGGTASSTSPGTAGSATSETTATTGSDTTATDSNDESPGFGIVGVLGALLAAALVVSRRD